MKISARLLSIPISAVLAAVLLCASPAAAATLHLDRSFGQDGTAAPDVGAGFESDSFTSVSQQADGQIRVTSLAGSADPRISGYLASGSPDPSVLSMPAPQGPRVTLSDGSVLAGSGSYYPSSIERLKPDGSLDTSWGKGGKSAEVGFWVFQILPLSTGQFVVVGRRDYLGENRGLVSEAMVARFEADGGLDAGFAGGSLGLRSAFGIGGFQSPQVISRPGGGLLVAVDSESPGSLGGADLVALTASGSLDASFGKGGIVPLESSVVAIHEFKEGGVEVAGTSSSGGRECCGDFSLLRFGPTGQPDASFGAAAGTATADFGGDDRVRTAQWEADGSVVLAGSTVGTEPSCQFFLTCWRVPALARFGSDGALDPGFGKGGLVRLSTLTAAAFYSGGLGVLGLSPRIGGGLLAVGSTGPVGFLAAVGSDGSLDQTFADGGLATQRQPRIPRVQAQDVAVDRQGRVLVAGSSSAGISNLPVGVVIRYKRNGALDTGYGRGRGYAYAGNPFSFPNQPSIAVDRRGRALVVDGNVVMRLAPSGLPDRSFGSNGAVRLPSKLNLTSVLALDNDKILLTAERQGPHAAAVVIRLLSDGRLDKSLRGGGIDAVPCRQGRACAAVKVARDALGRIVLAGYVMPKGPISTSDRRLALARLLASGEPDRGFGPRGWVVAGLSGRSTAADVAQQGRRILVAGWRSHGGHTEEVLLRYLPGGRPDRSFGRHGIARVSVPQVGIGLGESEPMSLLLTKDRIVVVRSGEGAPMSVYRVDGSHGSSFGGAGLIAPELEAHFAASPVGSLQHGDVIVAFNQTTPSGLGGTTSRVALQRLLLP